MAHIDTYKDRIEDIVALYRALGFEDPRDETEEAFLTRFFCFCGEGDMVYIGLYGLPSWFRGFLLTACAQYPYGGTLPPMEELTTDCRALRRFVSTDLRMAFLKYRKAQFKDPEMQQMWARRHIRTQGLNAV